MTEEQKIEALQRILQGANVAQVNLGDGYQTFNLHNDDGNKHDDAQVVEAEEVDSGMRSEGNEDPVITLLMPMFFNEKAEVVKFLSHIKGAKPTEITATVTRLVRERKISGLSCKGDMWKVMHDAGLYPNEKNTWNKQVII